IQASNAETASRLCPPDLDAWLLLVPTNVTSNKATLIKRRALRITDLTGNSHQRFLRQMPGLILVNAVYRIHYYYTFSTNFCRYKKDEPVRNIAEWIEEKVSRLPGLLPCC